MRDPNGDAAGDMLDDMQWDEDFYEEEQIFKQLDK